MGEAGEHRLTHGILCRHAANWLRRGARIPFDYKGTPRKVQCPVVLSELVCGGAAEIPDAIGWCFSGNISILVECKASRADFRADAKKRFRRRPQSGMGRFRYFLAPTGIIPVDELPELWGLLEHDGRKVVLSRLAQQHIDYAVQDELSMLWSALRRVQGVDTYMVVASHLGLCDSGEDAEHF